jgi:hypothetical protein
MWRTDGMTEKLAEHLIVDVENVCNNSGTNMEGIEPLGSHAHTLF